MAKGTKTLLIVVKATAKQAQRVFATMRKGMASVVSAGKKVGIGLAAGFSVATVAIVALTSKVLSLGDGLAKTADKLGTTTEELAALRHAAELSGIASNTLDMGLQRMVRRLSEAAQGSGEAVGAIEELGLSATALATMGPAQALQAIVEALDGVENQADKVRLAFKFFDSEGVSFVNLTGDALKSATEDAKAFGIAMSRQDAKAMENINDSITRVKAAITGASITLIKQFAPTLEKLGAKLAEWGASGKLSQWAKDLGTFLVDVIPKGVNIVLTAVGHLLTVFRGWQLLLSEIRIQWLNILILIQKGITLAAKFTGADSLESQKQLQAEMVKDRDKAIMQQRSMIQNNQKEQKDIEQIKKDVDGFVQSINEGTGSVETQTEKVNGLAKAYENAAVSAQKFANIGGGGSAPGQRSFGDPNLLQSVERTEGSD